MIRAQMHRHLAIIPDGNRRWARARGLPASEGHRAGISRVGEIAEAAWGAGVEVFTFWWGSPANLQLRDPDEVKVIVGVLRDWLVRSAPRLLEAHGAAFEIHGRWQELCPELGPGVRAARAASGEGPRKLVLLMAYDGRDELRAAAAAGGDFEAALWTGHLPDVDLVVRTGGEPHWSAAFLAWRAANAQLAFPEVRWPDFDGDTLRGLLSGQAEVARRFGR